MKTYTIRELVQTGANEYRTVGTGNLYMSRNGRRIEETVGVEYIPTKMGKIEQKKWFRLMEAAIDRENMGELLAEIEKACKRLAWLKTDQERHEYALQILSSRAYLHWPEWKEAVVIFFPFFIYAGESDDEEEE